MTLTPLPASKHWLYSWIDEFEVHNSQDVANRLSYAEPIYRLQELGAQSESTDYSSVPLSGTVVAGPGLETNAPGICSNYECQAKNIDSNFGNVLHYFDYVMMEGPSAREYTSRIQNLSSKRDMGLLKYHIAQDTQLLNYIRRIGLADYIVFSRKVCYCMNHLLESVETLGLAHLVEDETVEDLARRVSQEGGVYVNQSGPRTWFVKLEHPLFDGLAGIELRQKTRPKKKEAAARLIRNWLLSAVIDASTAHGLKAPLASFGPARFFERMQRSNQEKLSIDDVGARIQIPVLTGLSTRELIELRSNEYHHFEKFRSVLREAIAETIEKSDSNSPDVVAELVWQNKIRPGVADIERRIAASNRALRYKFAAAATVGGLAAAIGAIAGMPWLIGVGTLAAGTPLPQIFKATEERQQIEISDMYFLWKANRAHY